MLHINASSHDLLNKLEAVRLLCQAHRLRAALSRPRRAQCVWPGDARASTPTRAPTTARASLAYLQRVQDEDLTLGIAMTDAKGDRSLRPHEQAEPDAYVHIVERRHGRHRHLAAPRRS